MIEKLLTFKHAKLTRKPNYSLIPCTTINIDDDGAHLFNQILDWVDTQELNKIVRTPSGGISIQRKNLRLPVFDVRPLKNMVELTLLITEGMWRIQFRTSFTDNKVGIPGHKAFFKFSEICKKYGIDIQDYKIDNGPEVKKQIGTYMRQICRPTFKDKTFTNVHHIDFNSSFMANLCEEFPEFKPVGEYLYNKRKENPIYKGVMTNTIGYFHSDKHNYRWAHLAKAAINGNNRKVLELADKLRESGRVVLAYNTDGIWYQGEIYHDLMEEGTQLGQWKHDHINVTYRAKSANCYQFITDEGKCETVMSGKTLLDKVKPRETWEWGDIYRTDAVELTYTWCKGRIMKNGEVL